MFVACFQKPLGLSVTGRKPACAPGVPPQTRYGPFSSMIRADGDIRHRSPSGSCVNETADVAQSPKPPFVGVVEEIPQKSRRSPGGQGGSVTGTRMAARTGLEAMRAGRPCGGKGDRDDDGHCPGQVCRAVVT